MTTFHSSGNLQADRRYAYATGALADGDGQTAVDLFQQALELAPDWPPANFGLGEALVLIGNSPGAVEAFARTLALAPDDALGAALRLARLGAMPTTSAMRPGYVAALFDDYADRFDDHLVQGLAYRGPAIVMDALRHACGLLDRPVAFASALDLGCGTGLMARALQGHVTDIDGMDLSPRMVAKARATGLYRDVGVGDVETALAGQRYPLILAADVLVYMSDLTQLFRSASEALEQKGLFAFTFQLKEGDGIMLGPDLRYHHSAAHVRACAARAGFDVVHAAPCVTRQDGGHPVAGLVMVLAKPGNG